MLGVSFSLVSRGASQDKQPFAQGKDAFLTARKAAAVKSWDAALDLLAEIRLSKIEDVDVIEYATYSTLCAKHARPGVLTEGGPTDHLS